MRLEGVFKKGNKYFARVQDDTTLKSRFQAVPSEYIVYTPDKTGEYTYLLDESVKLKGTTYTSASDFKTATKTVEQFFNHYGKITPDILYTFKNFWRKSKTPESRIWYFDIEVIDLDNRKFPHAHKAEAPITHMQILDSFTNKIIILMTKDVSEDVRKKHKDVKFLVYDSEVEMLEAFAKLIQALMPTVITAWNGEGFDFPYITNRFLKLGLNINDLSPLHSSSYRYNEEEDFYDVDWKGLYLIDTLKAFKKFTYGEQKSYSLEYTAKEVLGVGKGKVSYEEYNSIFEFFEKDYDKFTEYAIQDVIVLRNIDETIGLLNLIIMMSSMMGCSYYDVFATVRPWTVFLTLIALKDNKIVPPKSTGSLGNSITGGFVKKPKVGRHNWEVSIDYNSLYPSIMVAFNISPETYIPYDKLPNDAKVVYDFFRDEDETKLLENKNNIVQIIDRVTKEHNIIFAGMGFYQKDKKGIIPTVVDEIYYGRKNEKNKMLLYDALLGLMSNNKQKDKKLTVDELINLIESGKISFDELYETEVVNFSTSDVDRVKKLVTEKNASQMAQKILINALYGAGANEHFILFNRDSASSITFMGRYLIQKTGENVEEYLTSKVGPGEYLVYIDTDSVTADSVIRTDVFGRRSISEVYIETKGEESKRSEDNYIKTPDEDIYTLSFNEKTRQVEDKKIAYMSKHKVKKEMFKISYKGKSVIVTADHSIIVSNNGNVFAKKPREINEQDEIIYIM